MPARSRPQAPAAMQLVQHIAGVCTETDDDRWWGELWPLGGLHGTRGLDASSHSWRNDLPASDGYRIPHRERGSGLLIFVLRAAHSHDLEGDVSGFQNARGYCTGKSPKVKLDIPSNQSTRPWQKGPLTLKCSSMRALIAWILRICRAEDADRTQVAEQVGLDANHFAQSCRAVQAASYTAARGCRATPDRFMSLVHAVGHTRWASS